MINYSGSKMGKNVGIVIHNSEPPMGPPLGVLHIDNPIALLQEASRVLAPGGTAAIIHWRTDIETPRGPSMPIRPSAEQCREWGKQAGLEFVRYESLCCCSWHWGLVMRRPARNV